MKKLMIVTCAIVLLFGVSLLQAGDAKWFDMENCGMCKHISTEEGLMEHMTWEGHKISNGAMMVCEVAKEYKEKYDKANAKMMATGEKLMKGEQMEMCGSCNALGSLFMKGLKSEQVKTKNGGIDLFTSENPEIVKELHAWVDKNDAVMKEMMKEQADHDSHEGHNH